VVITGGGTLAQAAEIFGGPGDVRARAVTLGKIADSGFRKAFTI
jgi:hypothetical protein